MSLELVGVQHLAKLTARSARLEMQAEPRQLHRDCGGAASLLTPAEIPRSTHDCDRIDARMVTKKSVFMQERCLHELWRNLFKRSEDAVFFVTA